MASKIEDPHPDPKAHTRFTGNYFTSDLQGRKVGATAKRNMCCLTAAWKAVKSFFANLFSCCLCCRQGKKSDPDLGQKTVTPQPTRVEQKKEGEQVATIAIASAAVRYEPFVSAQPPPVTHAAGSVIPPQPTPKEEDENALYLPLGRLKQKRKGYPQLFGASPIGKPTPFQLSQDVEKVLAKPELKGPTRPAKEAFVNRMKEIFTGLLQGKVVLRQNFQEQTFEGEISHPAHIQSARQLIESQITHFNTLLTGTREGPIDSTQFFAQFNMDGVEQIWQELLNMAQKPYLIFGEDLQLAEITAQVADNFKDHPVIKQNLTQLLDLLHTKPFVSNAPSPHCPSLKTVEAYGQEYLTQLREDVFQLFQRSIEEKDQEPKFECEHIQQIKNYFCQEITRFNKEVYALGIPFTNLDPHLLRREAFEDLFPIVGSWTLMKEMVSPNKGIDTKIELLEEIAQGLPPAEDPAWKKYPRIKDEMGTTLLPLGFGQFSKYSLDKFPSANRPGKYKKDQARLARINSAYTTMAQKLGCKDPKNYQIKHDITDDPAETERVARQLQAQEDAAVTQDDEALARQLQNQFY